MRWLPDTGRIPCRIVDPSAAAQRLKFFSSRSPFHPAEPAFERVARGLSEEERHRLLLQADAACEHVFDLLGSGPCFLGKRIDWHTDVKSGYRWDPATHHLSRSFRIYHPGTEIKMPWELSRCQHVAALGLAWRLTGQERYAHTFLAQINAWIEDNPAGRGVNWVCAMDVAIRAANWLLGLLLFEPLIRSSDRHQAFLQRINQSLWQHAVHIRKNLEWAGPWSTDRANHFVSDLAGLFALGVYFDDAEKGRRWAHFAQRRLEKEIRFQVRPDGAHFECSPSYHRLVLEMFLWCRSLAHASGRNFSASYTERVDRMMAFVRDYTAPDGRAPLFGDNDDGRWFTATRPPFDDHRYLHPAGRKAYFSAERFLLDGIGRAGGVPARSLAHYPGAGLCFVRTPTGFLGVRAGALAHQGAHAHNDQLSFILHLSGRPVIVDRGTGVYTPDLAVRNRYRSTAGHNTLQPGETEQAPFGSSAEDAFRLETARPARIVSVSRSRDTWRVEAEYAGYAGAGGLHHRRVWLLGCDTARLVLTDTISATRDRVDLHWRFHLAPAARARPTRQGFLIQAGDQSFRLTAPESVTGRALREVQHSPSYGRFERAQTLHLWIPAGAAPNNGFVTYRFQFDLA